MSGWGTSLCAHGLFGNNMGALSPLGGHVVADRPMPPGPRCFHMRLASTPTATHSAKIYLPVRRRAACNRAGTLCWGLGTIRGAGGSCVQGWAANAPRYPPPAPPNRTEGGQFLQKGARAHKTRDGRSYMARMPHAVCTRGEWGVGFSLRPSGVLECLATAGPPDPPPSLPPPLPMPDPEQCFQCDFLERNPLRPSVAKLSPRLFRKFPLAVWVTDHRRRGVLPPPVGLKFPAL